MQNSRCFFVAGIWSLQPKTLNLQLKSSQTFMSNINPDATPATTLSHGRPAPAGHDSEPESLVYDFLDNLRIDYHVLTHPAAFTIEECEAMRREIGVPVFKNLFLSNRQQTQFYLLMIPADKPFKTKYLSSQLGCARLSFASAEAMEKYLRIHPGAVSPLGLIHDKEKTVRLIVDRDLEATERYACHPCVNTASVALSLTDLLEKVIPATGHDFTWVDLKPE